MGPETSVGELNPMPLSDEAAQTTDDELAALNRIASGVGSSVAWQAPTQVVAKAPAQAAVDAASRPRAKAKLAIAARTLPHAADSLVASVGTAAREDARPIVFIAPPQGPVVALFMASPPLAAAATGAETRPFFPACRVAK